MPAISEPASPAGDLPLEALNDLVKGRVDVPSGPVSPKHAPERTTGDLDTVVPVDAWIPLFDDLDFEPANARLQAPDLRELVLGGLADLLGDSNAPALQDHVHARSLRSPKVTDQRMTDSATAALQPG